MIRIAPWVPCAPGRRRWLALLLVSAVMPLHAAVSLDLSAATVPGRVLEQVQPAPAAETTADGRHWRRYRFQPAPLPSLLVSPAGGWQVAEGDQLQLELQNAMPWAVTVQVEIVAAGGGRLQAVVGVPAGPPQRVTVPLHATSPRAFGMQASPPMPFDLDGRRTLVATTVEGALEGQRIASVRLAIPAPQATQTLLLGTLALARGDSLRAAYAGLIDRYGQDARGHWPEKVGNDQALRAMVAQPATADRPGPDRDGKPGRASGWFHVEKHADRWRLVTPAGEGFFSLGVNAVSADGGRSYVQGREWMFRELPPDRLPWSAFYGRGDSRRSDAASRRGMGYNHGRWFDFYAANLYRIDGASAGARWRDRALGRLQAWGFNTLGAWSDPALAAMHRLAYTRSINITGDYASVASGYDYWGRMPDPFDPAFRAALEQAVRRAVSGVRDDPWLLGYFADNELAWAGTGPDGRWGLALGTLRGPADGPAKRAWLARLRQQYRQPARLAAAWGIRLDSWHAIEAAGFVGPSPSEAHPAVAADYSAWLRTYADAYFRTVAEVLHRHDRHHLFLGGRFAVHTPEAVAACARYCDVVSFNTYADIPQHGFAAAAMHRLDKPVLIGEFSFGSPDRGPFGSGPMPVWTEAQRGEAYARFLQAAVADPVIVGVHWFQYLDEPASGRPLDGENAHLGLVGITDVPFAGFVEQVGRANRQALQATSKLPAR